MPHTLRASLGSFQLSFIRILVACGTFVNYAVWESTAQLKKAVNDTYLQSRLSKYAHSTVISPHIFKKVAVPGICVE